MAQPPALLTGDKSAKLSDQPALQRHRFEVELEFVQCLASPSYLNFLAQNEYFDSPDFVAYLKYLLYWKKPEYARFIVFPHALYFLHLLQESSFREALKRADYAMMLHQQQGYHWQFEKTLRLRSETINGTDIPDPSPDQQQQQQQQQEPPSIANNNNSSSTPPQPPNDVHNMNDRPPPNDNNSPNVASDSAPTFSQRPFA